MAMSLLIFLPFIKMDTPSETSISWGPIISNALARIVLVLGFRSAIDYAASNVVKVHPTVYHSYFFLYQAASSDRVKAVSLNTRWEIFLFCLCYTHFLLFNVRPCIHMRVACLYSTTCWCCKGYCPFQTSITGTLFKMAPQFQKTLVESYLKRAKSLTYL